MSVSPQSATLRRCTIGALRAYYWHVEDGALVLRLAGQAAPLPEEGVRMAGYPQQRQLSVDIKIKIPMGVRYDEEVRQWVTVCPVLDLYSQGDTEDQAISNIHEAVILFLETCYEMGTLNQVLQECGFHREEQRPDPLTIPMISHFRGAHAEATSPQF